MSTRRMSFLRGVPPGGAIRLPGASRAGCAGAPVQRPARAAALAVTLLLGAAASVAAQTVTSVEPPQGTTGTIMVIHGSGFGDPAAGAKQPKVQLVPEEGKPLKLAVVSFDDVQIQGILKKKKVPAGSYTVEVTRPGGSAPVPAPSPFVVPLPALTGTDKPIACAGSSAVVWGDFLGTREGDAWVGDRRAGIVSWAQSLSSPFDPGALHDRVILALPSTLEAGVHDLRVRNGTGEVVLEDIFTVLDHGVKTKANHPRMLARLTGDGIPSKLSAKGFDRVFWAAEELDPTNPAVATSAAPADQVARAALARVLAQAGPDGEEPIPYGTFLGAKAKTSSLTLQMVALVVPDWTPEIGTLIGDDALALEPGAVYLEGRFEMIGGFIELVSLRAWLGLAAAADIVVNGDETMTVVFAADELLLLEGEGLGTGPATIAIPEAVVANAAQKSL